MKTKTWRVKFKELQARAKMDRGNANAELVALRARVIELSETNRALMWRRVQPMAGSAITIKNLQDQIALLTRELETLRPQIRPAREDGDEYGEK